MFTRTIDTQEVLQSAADYFFDVSLHLRRCGKEVESNTLLRAGVEIALRAAYLGTGKVGCLVTCEKATKMLRASHTFDRATYRDVDLMLSGGTLSPAAILRLIRRLQKHSDLHLDETGPPRTRDEARRVYRGFVLPKPVCRSVASRRACQAVQA